MDDHRVGDVWARDLLRVVDTYNTPSGRDLRVKSVRQPSDPGAKLVFPEHLESLGYERIGRATDAAETERLREDRDYACRELDGARREVTRLRAKLSEMQRRAQRAEGIADRVAEGRPQHGPGRGLGRALANYAAHRAAQERDEARAELDRLRALVAAADALREACEGASSGVLSLDLLAVREACDAFDRVRGER